MFKKAIELKSHQRLSGADRKKLKRTVKDRFPAASDSDIDSLLPPKAEITVAKFQNRVHVYSVEAAFPVFFDIDGRGNEIFPTVYALWKVPDLMPSFLLKGGEVSRYVIGGADLMFPGISVPAEGLPSFSAGEPWAVKVPGNPAPIAVSYFLKFNAFELPKLFDAGPREKIKEREIEGRRIEILEFRERRTIKMKSLLWSKESVEGHYVPNAGFLEDVVFEDPASSSCQTSDSRDDATDSSHNQPSETNGKEVEDSVGAAEEHPILDSASVSQIEGKNDTAEGITSSVADFEGVTLGINKSSHKKLSKWLLAKSSTGLIVPLAVVGDPPAVVGDPLVANGSGDLTR
ncbi:hypothetical protein L484_009955 [Morus notabilis]|uniref:Uncharacterized protein n=1 Tax=Morus notabilis TaxID=981085 RepID=W9RA70_9ROSA|nr:hypothetical protein L484_009955 [Morus notabilis]